MRPQAGVDRLKPVPPMHANDLPVVGQAFSRNLQYYSNCAERASLHKYRCRIFLDFQRWAIWRIGRTGHFQPKQLILQVPSFRLPQHITSHLLTLGALIGALFQSSASAAYSPYPAGASRVSASGTMRISAGRVPPISPTT